MNKHYFEALADAAEFQARSYDSEALACKINDESKREKFYLELAESCRESAKNYQRMANEYDQV